MRHLVALQNGAHLSLVVDNTAIAKPEPAPRKGRDPNHPLWNPPKDWPKKRPGTAANFRERLRWCVRSLWAPGMSQNDVAELCGVESGKFSRMLNKRDPDVDTLGGLLQKTNFNANYLLTGEGAEFRK